MDPIDAMRLNALISKEAANIFSKINDGIPSLSKEQSQIGNLRYRAKIFYISDSYSAEEYGEFMTEIVKNPEKYMIVEVKDTWTQSGEFIRFVEYMEKVEDAQEDNPITPEQEEDDGA